MKDKIKILIVDNHKMFCESLATLISTRDELIVLDTANCGEEAIKKVKLLKPDIVLMDIEMDGLDGIQTLRRIMETSPGPEFIMLTMHCDEEYISKAMRAGAKGYVLKDSSFSQVLDAISAVSKGNGFLDAKLSYKLIRGLKDQKESLSSYSDMLSSREIEILRLIAEGYSNSEISNKLFISPHTTRNHIASIFMKLNCHSRTQAIIQGRKKGLI